MECNADRFPEGLRVLVVDDDPISLLIVERLLRSCLYQVTTCGEAVIALSMLRENRSRFDVVISDVHMPNMDGFKLLELVRLETDVPVIMMSANGETSNVMKGISQGACDYLLKPVRIEELQNIWQHVVRRKQSIPKQSGCASSPKGCQQPRQADGDTSLQLDDVENELRSSLKKRKDVKDEDTETEEDNLNSVKRQRVVWSVGLHQKFVSAVNQLGLEQAVPKRILDLMNVPGLTRENVASHLQKFRLYLKRISGSVNQQAGMISCTETSIDSFAWINGHADSQAVCQLPKVLVTPQMGTGGRFDLFNGEEIHCKESSSVNQLPAELHIDHRDLLLPRCTHPMLQIQSSVDPLLEDPINVHKSEFMPPPGGQLNMFSQNRSEHLMLEQCHRVPHLSSSSFGAGLNYSEIEHSNTSLKAVHHLLHVAQPESRNNVLPSLNGLVGLQQGFEEFPIKSMLPAVDCYRKKGLENGDLSPYSMTSNDRFLLDTFYKDSKNNLNPWVSAPSRTFTLPCLPEDSLTMSIPKVINEDEVRWRTTNNFLSSCDMHTVKVVCSPLRERSEESELNGGKDPDLILSMQGISGKQLVNSGFLNVQFEQSSNQEKPLCSNSNADLGWSRALSNTVIEELPTGSVSVFRQGQISR